MRKLLRRIFDKLPNDYKPYKFWWLWVAVAVIKTWTYTDFRTAKVLYIYRDNKKLGFQRFVTLIEGIYLSGQSVRKMKFH